MMYFDHVRKTFIFQLQAATSGTIHFLRIQYTIEEVRGNDQIMEKMSETNGTFAIGLSDISINRYSTKDRFAITQVAGIEIHVFCFYGAPITYIHTYIHTFIQTLNR